MDFSTLQSRVTAAYFPPHRTQLPPRMHPFSSPYPSPHSSQTPIKSHTHKFLTLLASLFTVPFLFYLFYAAQKIHRSSKFSDPRSQFFGVVIDCGSSGCRVRIYELLCEGNVPFSDGQMPLIAGSMKILPGLGGFVDDPKNAGRVINELVEFAKGLVPKREWGNTKVQLMATVGEEISGLKLKARERILDSCRQVFRMSGFAFKDEWARWIGDEEKGVYAWVAVNYAIGTLGGVPQKTTGIVEIGGTSLQAIFASNEVAQVHSLRQVKLAGVIYNLQTQSLMISGQDAAWEFQQNRHNFRKLTSSSSYKKGVVGDPCIPKGYELPSNASNGNLLLMHPVGNFTACRLEALSLLKSRKDRCAHPPCELMSSLFLELQGKTVSQENLFYTSKFFGLFPMASLFELEAAGRHYCENDWDKLKTQHPNIDDLDLLRYCFSSAYTVALLHDRLGIAMNEKRIGFANHTGGVLFDWTLGAFILQSTTEPIEQGMNADQIIGNESVTYFALFAFLLIALLAAFFVFQWRKPQLKTIYDLQKGHYIVTRVPR